MVRPRASADHPGQRAGDDLELRAALARGREELRVQRFVHERPDGPVASVLVPNGKIADRTIIEKTKLFPNRQSEYVQSK